MKRTPAEVFADFPSTQGSVPLTYLLDMFNPLQPRAFSISSSQDVHPTEIHLAVAIVSYKTKMLVPRVGVATSWFQELNLGVGGNCGGSGGGGGGVGASSTSSSNGGDMLAGLNEGEQQLLLTEPIKARIWVKKGTFKLPDATTPLIVVGPGTGCAPFRSILQQRILDGATENVMFFGNRNKDVRFRFEHTCLVCNVYVGDGWTQKSE